MTEETIATLNEVEMVNGARVIDVPRWRLDEAAEVLARAFRSYPVVQYVFQDHDPDGRHLHEMFRLTGEARMTIDEPVKGIIQDGRLVGAAYVDGPVEKSWPEALEAAFGEFAQRAGDGVLERFERYAELTAAHRPSESHYYLVVLGVLPEAQGRGYGRALLDHVHAMSAVHPTSTGVGLDTETTPNVCLYEHCGYRVNATIRLDDVPIWCMFRPDS